MLPYIERYLSIEENLQPGKVLVIYGPRQSGKTTFVQHFLESPSVKGKMNVRFDRGEYINIQNLYSSRDQLAFSRLTSGIDLLVIDEAQNIPDVGLALKLLVDSFPNLRIIVTGSSSFELSGQVGEPLLGRMKSLYLFPFWEKELRDSHLVDPVYHLSLSLVYGRYPEIWLTTKSEDKKSLLTEFTRGLLLKDLLTQVKIEKPAVLFRLVQLLAYQIGQEVSLNELASELHMNRATVEKYIADLEKTFILFPLRSYSRNLRNEIKKKFKVYFFDLGVRNAFIGDWNDLSERGDVGALWENFCILERLKRNHYLRDTVRSFFWRSPKGGEIDYLEEKNQKLTSFEFKWSSYKMPRMPLAFRHKYPHASFQTVHQKNYNEFVL